MVSEKIITFKKSIPNNVTLVAVSKTKPIEAILDAYEIGQRIFGENKVQELVSKYESLPKDIEWHLIGHLQTNKVKFIAPFVQLIHAVDSVRLLKEINKEAKRNNRIINCLLQFHVAKESTKYGFSIDEVTELLTSTEFHEFKHISICGIMGMATFTNDKACINLEFQTLHTYFNTLKNVFFSHQETFKELSMGMSDDFQLAIENGSTMIRIGSTLFGNR
jgi:pyridoxal phosphate enzyme (YggS family)